ncbi:MAG: hypothetical protein EOR30_30095 [Mesorhizobium sp.]|uniref:hypothetical protein n=1 Tax=Mesorhizobium sp. TaxID=1871066 RepID=UPI000FE41951|nr:hypothetical protein [Mesorhizobium sp.]TGQ37875.1 hypothetical protein EN857_14455 [Mesorhizobium sp. M4B.F.Ca.ET.214.01.1.1]TGQ59642.1 hypothetical protein EN854_17185 [Mesorhizobium sp. M4B.F.Ca.ET.211.01.1.1]TGU34708.1 hypothetical protein EN793_17180 [Mesorhizobium sp. M4B.F.Ca.ET.150.01.1.1]RWI33287.1 MAG: hypothetical protein EOR14_33080 [Mesorhizobium sp.]RWI61309.1 MAG: hypothetical protein EOR17_35115 [Mesorhizobium sp.]
MAFRLFVPILAGATLRERLFACIGATISIALTSVISGLAIGGGPHVALLVASRPTCWQRRRACRWQTSRRSKPAAPALEGMPFELLG